MRPGFGKCADLRRSYLSQSYSFSPRSTRSLRMWRPGQTCQPQTHSLSSRHGRNDSSPLPANRLPDLSFPLPGRPTTQRFKLTMCDALQVLTTKIIVQAQLVKGGLLRSASWFGRPCSPLRASIHTHRIQSVP